MSKIEIIDRAEERRLLDAWFETTSFDKPSKGIPKISDDEGDDEDETKSFGFGFESESKARHVRTPAGVRRYGQPLGTIIVGGAPLRNLTIQDRVFSGWERVRDSRGNEYDVGKRGNRWIATHAGEWDELEWGGSADEVFRALDARAGRGGSTSAPKPRAARTPSVAAAAPSRPKATTNYTREESDDPNYEKYKGADGKTYWAVQDEASKEWVLLDDDDNELDSSKSKTALLKKLNARAAVPEAPSVAPARTPRASRTPATPAPVTPARPAAATVSSDGLDEMSLTELRVVARSEMSTGSKLGTRASLIAAIRKHRQNQTQARTEPQLPKIPKATDEDIARGQRSQSSTMRNISNAAAANRAAKNTGRANHGNPGPQHEPQSTVRLKPHQLRVGMRVRMLAQYGSDVPEEEGSESRWYTIGQVGREMRTSMWGAGSRPRTAGMYHITDSRGKDIETSSPNTLWTVDEATLGGDERDRARDARLEGTNGRMTVSLPSERARRELGMPEPKLGHYGEVARDDPNYGLPAIAQRIQDQIDGKGTANWRKVDLTIEKSKYMLDKDEAVRELTNLMHNTSDAKDVEKLQKRIRQLQPDGPLMSAGQAAAPSPNSATAQRAERNMNAQMSRSRFDTTSAQETAQAEARARATARQQPDFSTMTQAQLDAVISSGTLSQAEEVVARTIFQSRGGAATNNGVPVDVRRQRAAEYRRSIPNLGRSTIVKKNVSKVIDDFEAGVITPAEAAEMLRKIGRTSRGINTDGLLILNLIATNLSNLEGQWKVFGLETEVKDFISGFEVKAVRYVRTPSGAQRFNQPIGSIIVRDGASPLSNLRAVAGNRLLGSDGTRYRVGQANGRWEARAEGRDEAVVHGDSQEQVLTRLNAHAADSESRSSSDRERTRSGDSGSSNAPTRQHDKDHAEHGDAYKGADGKTYYIKGEDDDYVIRDKDGNVIGKKRDKGEALKELERYISSSTGAGPDEAPSGDNGNDDGDGPPNAPSGSAPSGASGGSGPAPNTPENRGAIQRQLQGRSTPQLRQAAQRNGMPNAENAPRESIIAWLLKYLVRKMLGDERQTTQNTAAYGALLELKSALEELEEKLRVVRTAAGAARYGVPIGTPISEGGKPRLGAGITKRSSKPKLTPEMRSHREGFKRLHTRLAKKSETQGMAGSVMSLVEQIDAGEITNEDQLMGVVARIFTPDQFGVLLANMKSIQTFQEIKTLIDVKADKQEHTGAMIALIPTREDARRLVDKEGEDLDELHVTLAFLGKAADISESARYAIIGRIAGLAGNVSRPGAEAFAVNVFNPNGEEPCVVMGVNGKGPALNDLHNHTMMALGDVESGNNWHMPDQHSPWVPHITLRYFGDGDSIDADWLMEQFDKTGPVEFDRIRVAFGGNNIDFPLYDGMVKGDVKKLVITPGGRVGDDSSHNISPRDNWVDKRGGLPKYIRTIRNGIMREQGKSESAATALAIAAVKRWASGRGNVSPAVRAAAAKAVAQWEAMKSTKSVGSGLSGAGGGSAGVGAAPARSYLADRMAEGGRIAGAARQSMSRDPAFNDKHPRGQGGKFGNKPGQESASSLSNAMKKRLPIEYGQQGPVVKQIQILVGKLGFPTEKDGIFGDKTKAAVKAAQKRLGLKPTGTIDEETFLALMSAVKPSKNKS